MVPWIVIKAAVIGMIIASPNIRAMESMDPFGIGGILVHGSVIVVHNRRLGSIIIIGVHALISVIVCIVHDIIRYTGFSGILLVFPFQGQAVFLIIAEFFPRVLCLITLCKSFRCFSLFLGIPGCIIQIIIFCHTSLIRA
jgi:hypothetical protein